MRYFGFYDAMPYALGAGVRVADLPRWDMSVDRVDLARYMGACAILTVVLGVENDPFAPSREVMGGFSLKTDGEWIWPDIAGHLVREHDFAVPPEFEERSARLGFTAPVLTHQEVVDIFH
ncbi:hypothetical protein [Streptomyces melanogenes]|uniref:hypothetical protein n=1 Tax=Streptomyces melanogenes TaxID=67326 RepID=UPI0037927C6B